MSDLSHARFQHQWAEARMRNLERLLQPDGPYRQVQFQSGPALGFHGEGLVLQQAGWYLDLSTAERYCVVCTKHRLLRGDLDPDALRHEARYVGPYLVLFCDGCTKAIYHKKEREG